VTITEALKEAGVEYLESGHHHCRTGWVQIRECPFCHSANYHLGYSVSGRFFACWKCGGHNAYQTLDKLGVSRESIKELLQGLREKEDQLPSKVGKLKEPQGRGPLLAAHRAYLEGRGFDVEEIVRVWQIEGIGPIPPRLAWRIYIPVIVGGRRVAWTTRAIGGRVTQRYLSASDEDSNISIKKVLYGIDYCHLSAVITEGPLDAWAVGRGAVALCGTAFTPAQCLRLTSIPYRFICFDSSHEAQLRARSLANELAVFPGVTTNVELDAKDPAEASAKELKQLRKLARLS